MFLKKNLLVNHVDLLLWGWTPWFWLAQAAIGKLVLFSPIRGRTRGFSAQKLVALPTIFLGGPGSTDNWARTRPRPMEGRGKERWMHMRHLTPCGALPRRRQKPRRRQQTAARGTGGGGELNGLSMRARGGGGWVGAGAVFYKIQPTARHLNFVGFVISSWINHGRFTLIVRIWGYHKIDWKIYIRNSYS